MLIERKAPTKIYCTPSSADAMPAARALSLITLERIAAISMLSNLVLGGALIYSGQINNIMDGVALTAASSAITSMFLGIVYASKKRPKTSAMFFALAGVLTLASTSQVARDIFKNPNTVVKITEINDWQAKLTKFQSSDDVFHQPLNGTESFIKDYNRVRKNSGKCYFFEKHNQTTSFHQKNSFEGFPNKLKNTLLSKRPSMGMQIYKNIYEKWFSANKFLSNQLKKYDYSALSAIQGMALLEPHAIARSLLYQQFTYMKDPESYGINIVEKSHTGRYPVLLLPGAIGTWNYLGDLAIELKRAGYPVFVIDIDPGKLSNRQKIWDKIKEIKNLYSKVLDGKDTTVDIVAHSMGANLGFASVFSNESSFIDEEGNFKFRTYPPKANPWIGKVITIANPLESGEIKSLKQANKINNFFNIIAKYDGIMGHKQPGLIGDLSHQANEVSAGHIGIVFDPETHALVIDRLKTS